MLEGTRHHPGRLATTLSPIRSDIYSSTSVHGRIPESDPLKLRLPDFAATIQNTIYKPSSLTTSVTAKGSSTPFPSGAIFAA